MASHQFTPDMQRYGYALPLAVPGDGTPNGFQTGDFSAPLPHHVPVQPNLQPMSLQPQSRVEASVLSPTNLYICGLPLMFNSHQLKALFSRFGPISETRILNNSLLMESKGVGFVHFVNSGDAQRAVDSMNNFCPEGLDNSLVVRFARDVRKNSKRALVASEGGAALVEDGNSFSTNCKYFAYGKCNKGDQCNFAHAKPAEDIRSRFTPLSESLRSLSVWGLIPSGSPSPQADFPKALASILHRDPKESSAKGPTDPSTALLGETASPADAPQGFPGAHGSPAGERAGLPRNEALFLGAGSQSEGGALPVPGEGLFPPPRAKAGGPVPFLGGMSKTNLYVSQFPREWTSGDLERLFSQYGEIDKTRILTPENAERNRGVGFVHFKESEDAFNAMTNSQNFIPGGCTKPIIVKFANQGSKFTRMNYVPAGTCKFWIKGECSRGALCSFKHSLPAAHRPMHPHPRSDAIVQLVRAQRAEQPSLGPSLAPGGSLSEDDAPVKEPFGFQRPAASSEGPADLSGADRSAESEAESDSASSQSSVDERNYLGPLDPKGDFFQGVMKAKNERKLASAKQKRSAEPPAKALFAEQTEGAWKEQRFPPSAPGDPAAQERGLGRDGPSFSGSPAGGPSSPAARGPSREKQPRKSLFLGHSAEGPCPVCGLAGLGKGKTEGLPGDSALQRKRVERARLFGRAVNAFELDGEAKSPAGLDALRRSVKEELLDAREVEEILEEARLTSGPGGQKEGGQPSAPTAGARGQAEEGGLEGGPRASPGAGLGTLERDVQRVEEEVGLLSRLEHPFCDYLLDSEVAEQPPAAGGKARGEGEGQEDEDVAFVGRIEEALAHLPVACESVGGLGDFGSD